MSNPFSADGTTIGCLYVVKQQLVPLSLFHASGLARICSRCDGQAVPCTKGVGVALFVGALLWLNGGEWVYMVSCHAAGLWA